MARIDEAVGGIDGVKQRLVSLCGFMHAYWLQPLDGHGLMVSFWEDEDAAKEAAPPAGFSPASGVAVVRVETRAVIAEA